MKAKWMITFLGSSRPRKMKYDTLIYINISERLRETRAPTQLLIQLGFIHDAVKSVHFVNFTTNSCNSYYNKLVLFKDFNT